MKLLILGAGGQGHVVKESSEATNIYETISFLDDDEAKKEITIGKLSDCEKLRQEYSCAFAAFGNHELRIKWLEKLKVLGYAIPVIIHPSAYVSPSAKIGSGTFVGAKCVVNTSSVVGCSCILSVGSIIDHNSKIGDGCHIECCAIIKSNSSVPDNTYIDSSNVFEFDKIKGSPSNYSFDAGM